MRQVKKLPYGVRLWVPGKRSRELGVIRRDIVEALGGLTETQSWGYWADDNGNVIGEPVAVLEAFHDHKDVEKAAAVFEAAAQALLDAGEIEVLIEVSGGGRWERRLLRA